jgi:hypothetical protein
MDCGKVPGHVPPIITPPKMNSGQIYRYKDSTPTEASGALPVRSGDWDGRVGHSLPGVENVPAHFLYGHVQWASVNRIAATSKLPVFVPAGAQICNVPLLAAKTCVRFPAVGVL